MLYKIIWSPDAEEDLEELYHYYARIWLPLSRGSLHAGKRIARLLYLKGDSKLYTSFKNSLYPQEDRRTLKCLRLTSQLMQFLVFQFSTGLVENFFRPAIKEIKLFNVITLPIPPASK